jgi:hypothetical protein
MDDIIGALHSADQESDSLAHKARKRGAPPQPLPCGLHVPDAGVACVFRRKFIERAAVEIKFIQNKMGTDGDASPRELPLVSHRAFYSISGKTRKFFLIFEAGSACKMNTWVGFILLAAAGDARDEKLTLLVPESSKITHLIIITNSCIGNS